MRWPEITKLLIRALGILITARASFDVAVQLYTISNYDFVGLQAGGSDRAHGALITLYFLSPLAFLALGLTLVLLAPPLVQRFSRAPATDQAEINLGAIENALIAVVGLYFVAHGISDLAQATFSLAFNVVRSQASISMSTSYGAIFSAAVKLLIGGVLIIRNQGISAIMRHINNRVRKLREWPG